MKVRCGSEISGEGNGWPSAEVQLPRIYRPSRWCRAAFYFKVAIDGAQMGARGWRVVGAVTDDKKKEREREEVILQRPIPQSHFGSRISWVVD